MSKVLHPNQYQALLEYQDDLLMYQFGYGEEPILAQHVNKELNVTYTPHESTAIYEDRTNRPIWDIYDKKCRYYRKEYGNGYDYAERLCNKHAGKTVQEILKLGLSHIKTKLRDEHFYKLGLISYMDYIHDQDSSTCSHIVIDGLVHYKDKIITTKKDANLFKYELLTQPEVKDLAPDVFNKYLAFVSKLETEGYSVDIDPMATSFQGLGIKGYVSITPDNYTYDLVFADHALFYNKVSRCPLVFRIPKSSVGIVSAIKELDYLGSKYAWYALKADEYKHVHPIKWWNS